jgi:peptide/nickel transport system permease protein
MSSGENKGYAAKGVGLGARLGDAVHRFFDSDLWYSFTRSPVVVVSAVITFVFVFSALFAPLVAPHNPFDLATIDLLDAELPPVWLEGSDPRFLLGTDAEGRDILSTVIYGSRISLGVGFASVLFAMVLGISLGLLSGYLGGTVDAVIMRLADVQLTFPAILIALLIDGLSRTVLPRDLHGQIWFYVLVLAIGLSFWVQYARTVRAYCAARPWSSAARNTSRPRGSSAFRRCSSCCATCCPTSWGRCWSSPPSISPSR